MQKNSKVLIFINILVSLLVFGVDLNLQLGVAGGVPYVLVILLALYMDDRRSVIIFALSSTFLTVLGYFFSPAGGVWWIVLTNRCLALFAIWSVALVGLWAKRSQALGLEMEKIIESSPVSMIAVNAKGLVVKINSQAEFCFGYSREEAEGKSVLELIPERYRVKHLDYQADFFQNPSARGMGQGRELFALRKGRGVSGGNRSESCF